MATDRFKMPRPPAETLCETCEYGMVTRGENGIRSVRCNAGMDDRHVHFKVVDCTGYYERGKVSRSDYEKTAWIIVSGGGRKIGFLRPGTPEHKKATGREA